MLRITSFLFLLSAFTVSAMDQAPSQRIVKRKFSDTQDTISGQSSTAPRNVSEHERLLPEPSKTGSTLEEVKPRLASVVVRVEREQKKERKESTTPFIYDNYTARRGEPKMLDIRCAYCDSNLITYQKDGPGALLRCYLDRIHAPNYLRDRQYERFDVRRSPLLRCHECQSTIGIPMIYKAENRPAYRMLRDKFYIK